MSRRKHRRNPGHMRERKKMREEVPEPPAGFDVRDYCRDCETYHGGGITCEEAEEIRGDVQ